MIEEYRKIIYFLDFAIESKKLYQMFKKMGRACDATLC